MLGGSEQARSARSPAAIVYLVGGRGGGLVEPRGLPRQSWPPGLPSWTSRPAAIGAAIDAQPKGLHQNWLLQAWARALLLVLLLLLAIDEPELPR